MSRNDDRETALMNRLDSYRRVNQKLHFDNKKLEGGIARRDETILELKLQIKDLQEKLVEAQKKNKQLKDRVKALDEEVKHLEKFCGIFKGE